MTSEISPLLQAEQIASLFQPIVDSHTIRILGFEALSRGPSDSPLHPPAALFAAAQREGMTARLDFACFRTAVRGFASLQLDGRLFVNLTPEGLISLGDDPDSVSAVLAHNGMSPADLVFELTERSILADYEAIRRAMRTLGELGVAFAIGDLGAGYSGLRAWS
jgi:EAL domain-containing protein (putative c-di-GMP-specific phosphodiesterase class I)